MHFQTLFICAAALIGLAAAVPSPDLTSRQTVIGTVQFVATDGTTVKSNMEVGAGYRQLTQPGEQKIMTQLVGTSDNLVCSSQSNDGKTTTVVGTETSDIDPAKQQVVVKCDFIQD